MKEIIKKYVLLIFLILLIFIGLFLMLPKKINEWSVNISENNLFSFTLWEKGFSVYGNYCLISDQRSNCEFKEKDDGQINFKFKNMVLEEKIGNSYIFNIIDSRSVDKNSFSGKVKITLKGGDILWELLSSNGELIIPQKIELFQNQ